MKLKHFLLGILFAGIFPIVIFTFAMNEQRDKIEALQLRCAFLEDYKRAYMDHIPKCAAADSMHTGCIRMKETETVLPNVSK